MGGGIRKDMNPRITHLISTHSGGAKYAYAKTFRLTVVRPAWVYTAWERRNETGFRANTEEFSNEHKLKAFEGQKICFFGFPADEHDHMVEVLESNGGISAELEDPQCSHVVMSNTGGHFFESFSLTTDTAATNTSKNFQINPISKEPNCTQLFSNQNVAEAMEVDNDFEAENNNNKPADDWHKLNLDENSMELGIGNNINEVNENNDEDRDDRGYDDFDERLAVDFEDNLKAFAAEKEAENNLFNEFLNLESENFETAFQLSHDLKTLASTPKSSKIQAIENNSRISPVTKNTKHVLQGFHNLSSMYDDNNQRALKRRRESFESVTSDSSAKKPKLLRLDSISRTFRRSISFVAERTPISRLLRRRRSSVAVDGTEYLKDKFLEIPDNSNCSSRKEKVAFNSTNKTPEKVTVDDLQIEKEKFKTPKAPIKIGSGAHTLSASKKPLSTSAFKSSNTPLSFIDSPCSSQTYLPTSTISALSSQNTGLDSTICTSLPTILTSSCTTFNAFNNNTTLSNPSKQVKPIHHQANDNQDTKCPTQTVAIGVKMQNELLPVADQAKMVVDEHTTQVKPEPKNNQTHILKTDWFWYTIQNGYADENEYLFGDYLHSIANTPNTDRRDSLPISFNNRKRKHFLQSEGTPSASKQRHSSDLLSVSGSSFDCTSSPDKLETGKILTEPESSALEETPAKKCSMRFNHFMDFYNTESNYVGILDTIVNLFKNPLEKCVKDNDALINKSKIKAIFGNFLPIHEVHQSMLERLRAMYVNWSEDCLIGDIILQYRDDLIKAYPPYVNFFEQIKETLMQCDQQYPRFHAFLKINQTKPECGRQSLQDLMIRPVQRLPSISLLLNDILKHTNKNNADHARLEEALKAIKEVTMHINEDKRKTESRMAIFDIFNDIEDCPAHLVSSNRNFISRCEVNELSNNLSGRGDSLMLYLFSDTIEVCKKRSRGFNSAKSPGSTKAYKHVKLISLNAIRFVIDITDSLRAFALLCRHDKDKLHSFTIVDEEVVKVIYLKALCKQMAENACRTDTNKPLLSRTSQELEVDISDVNLSTLSKAFKLAARTRLKVGRAFSFNKTPSKLKRAVSTMMTSPFGSTNSLTPASQLAQMRLASCTNIHEVTDEDGSNDMCSHSPSEVLIPPLSVQPTRKNKSSTLGSVGRI
uniref:DH domain-containing protein n=1 Tax=Glossina brevipalpis TaxID=37001 RepID=A0A1A9W7P0_9MUSC